MKILITGMSSSNCRENGTIAGRIAEALRAGGHEVDVSKPSLKDVLEDNLPWDKVYVGIGPVHGIGSASIYGALGLIGAYWPTNKLTLYTDDHLDAGKIGSGLRLFDRDKWRIVKPFYGSRREYHIASDPPVTDWLNEVIHSLARSEEEYPDVIVPAFTTDQAINTTRSISIGAMNHTVAADFSSLISMGESPEWTEPTDDQMKGEWLVSNTGLLERFWYSTTSRYPEDLEWPVAVHPFYTYGYMRKATAAYLPIAGWHYIFKHAMELELPVATDWKTFGPVFGESWEALPANIEHMSASERSDLAFTQRREYDKVAMSLTQLTTALEGHRDGK